MSRRIRIAFSILAIILAGVMFGAILFASVAYYKNEQSLVLNENQNYIMVFMMIAVLYVVLFLLHGHFKHERLIRLSINLIKEAIRTQNYTYNDLTNRMENDRELLLELISSMKDKEKL